MQIDAHQHFWRYHPDTHAWISDGIPQLKRDFLPADLQPLLAAAGLDGCVAVQAQQNVTETAWLLQLADQHSFIRGVIGWVDLCAADVADALRRFATHPRFRGVRHIVQDEPDDRFMLRPDFQRGIATLAEFGLTYDILIYARQLPAAIELARRFPQQRFVLDHIAKPDMRARRIDAWRRDLTTLAACPNVSCKLSGMLTEADWQSWKPTDFTAYLDIALDTFGAARLMIGSDWPMCTLAASYAETITVVTNYIARLSSSERDAILGTTAVGVYGLSAPLIYHLVPESELRAGIAGTAYRPARFAEDGFVHCAANPASVLAVARDYFSNLSEPLLVLCIEPSHLISKLIFEAPAPIAGGGTSHLQGVQLFPHVYGPVNLSAVTGAAELSKTDGQFRWPEGFVALPAFLSRHG
jgi:L-fuconolactonase